MTKSVIEQQITFLFTKDLDETTDFYAGVLNLPMVLDQGACRIFQVSPDGYLGFCLREELIVTDGVIFTIVTEQVDEFYEILLKHDIQTTKPPTLNQKFQIYHLFFRDPNGYLIEIQKFLDSKWYEHEE